MRLHATLLLLLGSLAVADAASCNVIKLSGGFMQFGQTKITLVCANSAEQIEYGGRRFKQLDCNAGKWTHKGDSLTPPLPAGQDILNYRCVGEKSAGADDVFGCNTVKHANNGRPRIIYGVTRLVCDNANESIEYAQKRFEQLDCSNGKWTHDGGKALTPPPTDRTGLHYKCVPKRPSVPVIDKCDRSLIRGLAPVEIHFDEATRKLTCVNKRENSLTSIESNSLLFNFLTCNAINGWMGRGINGGGRAYGKLITADSAALNIACVEYCRWTGVGTKVEKLIKQHEQLERTEEYIKVSCEDPSRELFYDGRHTGGSASCYSGEVGWVLPDGPIPANSKTTTMLFECREVTPVTRGPVTSTLKTAPIPTTKQAPVTTKTITPAPASAMTTLPVPATTTTLRSTTETTEETWTTTRKSGESINTPAAGAVAHQVSTTTIVCCVLGGIFLIVLAIAAIFCYKSAKKRAEMSEKADEMTYKNYEMSDSNMDEV